MYIVTNSSKRGICIQGHQKGGGYIIIMDDFEDSIISSMLMGGGGLSSTSVAVAASPLSDGDHRFFSQPIESDEELGIGALFAAAALSAPSPISAPPMIKEAHTSVSVAELPSPTTSLLDQFSNMEPPFMSPRPLPPPLIPCIGYDDPLCIGLTCENIVGERPSFSAATPPTGEILESLQSELIWLLPQYPTNRLVLMSPDDIDDDGHDNVMNENDGGRGGHQNNRQSGNALSLDAEIVDILKNRAFGIPLPPIDERKVLDALSGADVEEEKASEEDEEAIIGNKKQSKKTKKDRKSVV